MAAPTFRQAASPTGGPTPGIVPTGLTLAATLRQLGFTLPFVGEFNEALVATPDVIGRILDAAGSTCFTGQVERRDQQRASRPATVRADRRTPLVPRSRGCHSTGTRGRPAGAATIHRRHPIAAALPIAHCEAQLIQLILITRMCTTCIAKATQQGS
jgi:hypothetical protein